MGPFFLIYTPTKKGGSGKSFRHAEGGGATTSFGVVLTRELEVLAILERRGTKVSIV